MGLSSVRGFSFARVAVFVAAAMLLFADASAGQVIYEVNPASGRLEKATFPDQSYITYTYDANGNLLSAVVTQAVDTTPPGAPGTPTFSGITATSATATWTAASDNVGVTSYEWSRNGGSTWNSVGNALTANITGLTGSTNYTVLVRARDAANNPGATSSSSFSTSDITPPGAPGIPVITNITATSATATWTAATDNVGVTAYEWSRNGGATWTSVGASLTASLSGLSGSTTYTFQVRARDAAGNPGAVSQRVFTTSDVTPPTAPGTPTFSSITSTSAVASWAAATDNVGVTAYEWSRNGGSTWTSAGLSLSASLSGLTGSTNYTVLVRARDAAGNPGATSSGSFTTAPAQDTIPPGPPGTPQFSLITATSATASWTAASDNVGVTSYEYSTNGGGNWTSNGLSLSVNLTSLSPAVTYTFQVRAKDAANNPGQVSASSFTTLDNVPPSQPGAITFSSINASSATASWGAATDNVGILRYEYSINGGSNWTSTGAALSANLTGLSSAVTYTILVRAIDTANNPGPNRSNSFTTLDNIPPGAPGAPTFTSITASSATASWGAASDNVGILRYEYSINGGSSWTNAGAALSANLGGLSSAVTYTLLVRAFDTSSNPGPTSSNSFTTLDNIPPGAPGTPTFTSIAANSATASWGAASDNVAILRYEYSINGGSSWTNAGAALSANLSGLSSVVTYTVLVRAFDTSNNPGPNSSNSFTTLDNIPPSAPGTPSFSALTSTSATASWGAASDNVGILRYEYSLNGGGWTSVGTALSVNLSGLSAGGSYTFQVRAVDTSSIAGSASSNSFNTVATITMPVGMGFATVGPGGSTSSFSITSGGDLIGSQQNGAAFDAGDWLSPKVGMGDFQVFVTVDSNPCSSGNFNSWLSLSGTWSYTRSVSGTRGATQQCNITLQIRHVSNPSVILHVGHVALTAVGQ